MRLPPLSTPKASVGVSFLNADLGPGASNDIATTALTQLLALPKAGKTAGAEHRAALYAMVGRVVGASETSEVSLKLWMGVD